MKNNSPFLVVLISCLWLSSCSVYMASQQKGASEETIKQCKTRTCLQTNGAELISQRTNKQDVLSEEVYQVQKPRGSAARAVAHGALDVATLGLWEVAATPIEGVLNSPDRYNLRVMYKADGETIKKIQVG